jgi:hypothetical protein
MPFQSLPPVLIHTLPAIGRRRLFLCFYLLENRVEERMIAPVGLAAGEVAMDMRDGETTKNWFRASRFYSAQGAWYCVTRECGNLGPCDSRADAEVELMMFMRHLREGRPAEGYRAS